MKLLAVILAVLVAGCASAPLGNRGGIATIGKALLTPFSKVAEAGSPKMSGKAVGLAGDGDLASITQSDNPEQESAQNYDFTHEEEITFAAATVITERTTDATGAVVEKRMEVPAGSKRVVRDTQTVKQTIGASRKDTAGQAATFMASFKWVQGLGVITLLLGAVGFAHPIARKLIGGKDTAIVISLCGVGMIAGPFLLVRYSDWFALGILAAAVYWFFSRAKHKEGQLDAINESKSSTLVGPK